MLIDGEEYSFYLVNMEEPFLEAKIHEGDELEICKKIMPFPPMELHARFNGGHLVWANIDGEWVWD